MTRHAAARIRPAAALDAVPLSRLYASVTPAPVQRLEAVRIHDWERQGRDWRVPRSSLAPILRFADVDAFVQEAPGRRQRTARSSTRSPRSASRRRTSRTTSR